MKLDDIPLTLRCTGEAGTIDVSGMYVGICTCGEITGMVPGGECAHCEAPEDQIARDPELTSRLLLDQDR